MKEDEIVLLVHVNVLLTNNFLISLLAFLVTYHTIRFSKLFASFVPLSGGVHFCVVVFVFVVGSQLSNANERVNQCWLVIS